MLHLAWILILPARSKHLKITLIDYQSVSHFDVLHNVKQSCLSTGGELGVAMFFEDEFIYELIEEGRPGEYIELRRLLFELCCCYSI